ncbi:ATPase family AAA domain-containing protein 2-like isoform X3 [Anser cygnoides]|uniref:ATPase family AAA domain-containing protein 2-like isoform X3 n=1 Tax=Anser cygnoides TaxID=8845 RepID=UPI0034D18E23
MKIKAKAFFMALKKVVPASNRIVASPGQALSPIFKPLFENSVANILQAVQKTFLHAELALKKDRQQDNLNPILQDDILDSDDDASSISGDELPDKMPDRREEKFLCFCRSAYYKPTSCQPHLLIVGKAGYGQDSLTVCKGSIELQVRNLEKFTSKEDRTKFFEDLTLNGTVKPPVKKAVRRTLEVLPVASPAEPQEPTEEEVGLLEEELEDTLRELRVFLRELTQRLATDRRFVEFTKPVDPQKVPGYATVIKEAMDLSPVLSKIDSPQYLSAGDFLKDIDLICNNALEYNPDQRPADS